MHRGEFSDLERREITLWRVLGRYDEAQQAGDTDAMARLEAGFRKRLTAYEQLCRQEASACYRMLGNAVAVPVVEWIARRIVAIASQKED